MASQRASTRALFRLPGFYPGNGPFLPTLNRDELDRFLQNILGDLDTYNNTEETRAALTRFIGELLAAANRTQDIYLALRAHAAYFETLAQVVDEHTAGEVTGSEVAALLDALAVARANYNPPSSRRIVNQLTTEADNWLRARQHVAGLPPLTTGTVVVHNAPTTVSDVTSGLSGAPFGLGTANAPWPPEHFNAYERSYFLDPQIRHQIAGVTVSSPHPEKQPARPNMGTPPLAAKLYLTYSALSTHTPDKSWSLFLLPVGPFWSVKDRAQWKPATGRLSRVCATWEDFEKRAKECFAAGQRSIVALFTPWPGTPAQVINAVNNAHQQGELWASRCSRQGLVIVLHKITRNGNDYFEYILYDPTLSCPRIRDQPAVKGSLMRIFEYRRELKDAVENLTEGAVVRGWVGGGRTSLVGTPDSVEMSSDFIREVVTSPAQDPFDIEDYEWQVLGFSPMHGYD